MVLFKIFARRQSRRDDTLPSVCYAACQDQQIEAQSRTDFTGMCDEGTAFRDLYDQCVSCIMRNSDDAASVVVASFQKYFQYCDFDTVQLYTLTQTATFAGQAMPITFTTDVTFTLKATTISNTSANITSTSTSVSTPLTSANSTVSASPTIATNSNLIPSAESTASANPDSDSKAWMAGPVVGSISGVAVVALGVFLWYRRRMAKRKTHPDELTDKPQLHSDCVPRQPPDELDAGMRHELPGDEPGKWNAPISELPVDNATLEKKTYGKNELPSYEPEQLPS